MDNFATNQWHQSNQYALGYEQSTPFHIEEAIRNMMEETKSYMDDFLEFTRVFGCLTEIQANIKKN